MAIHLSSIETRIRAEFSLPTEELHHIFHEVREAVTRHIHENNHRPRDIFQMRLATHDELIQAPPNKQVYLIINFGEHPLDSGYMTYLQSYYGKAFFFHFHLNHSLTL